MRRGALLRDQLRQAAQMWEERGQPEDLLWTGTSYNEYQLWHERYAGGLSGAEETFARAMTAKAGRRRRRRRTAIAAAFALLLAVLTVVGMFWRQAETQALRAEASQLLALGRLEIEDYPTGALAYALASLERADDPLTRIFALEAVWRGPTALILSTNYIDAWLPKFSPDGKWLAAIRKNERYFELWPSTGGEPKLVDTGQDTWEPWSTEFASAGDLLVTRSHPSHAVQIWSFPDGRLVRTLPTQGTSARWTFVWQATQNVCSRSPNRNRGFESRPGRWAQGSRSSTATLKTQVSGFTPTLSSLGPWTSTGPAHDSPTFP